MADKVFPYKGSSEERLTSEFNFNHGLELVYNVDFTFDSLAREQGPEGRNTIIRIVPTDPDKGPSWHRYTRLWLSVLGNLRGTALVDGVYVPVVPNQTLTIHELLPEINEQLGLSLREDEVVNTEYTLDENASPIWMELKISQSVAWLPGSSFTFGLNQSPGGVGL